MVPGGGGGGAGTSHAGALELDAARQVAGGGTVYKFYHGTSWSVAEKIARAGFRASVDGCLGPGVYVARRDKAERFAQEASRHGRCVGGLVEVLVTVRRPKFVDYNDRGWRSEGFDACRAESTSASTNMEWCIADASQVQVLRVSPVRCVGVDPAPEEAELDQCAAALKAEIAERQGALDLITAWHDSHRRERERKRAEAEQQERKRKEEAERQAQEQKEAEERSRIQAERHREEQQERERQKARGTKITYSLTSDAQETADVIDGEKAKCIAMGSEGDEYSVARIVVIDDDGSFSHCAGMPETVHKEFTGKHKLNQSYVALGTEGRFFIQRKTGYTQWSGGMHEEFSEYVKENSVKHVTFGEYSESWFVLTDGGGFTYAGAPDGFCEAVKSKKYSKKTFADVSWGPKGEWWARWTDGTWKCNGVCDECDEKIKELQRGNWDIKQIVFGPNDEWIIRYDS
jgi:hypothetical protein